ncbi:50S ribosomal protein L28 [Buchnera aphidicola (Anoecia corni)]|uniref:Large ribosomal subunit protein bL28 n=1 Tax=Buchnera aphidicola (Anoecia corni) TaxID=2994477 RepID=A0AAT9IFU7_9GAMM
MSKFCQITKRKSMTGHNRSHAMNATKRKFFLNLKVHKFWIPSEKRFIKLKISTKGIREIEKKGVMHFMHIIGKKK